jgi:uncharacterized membrane protein YkoI
MKKVFVICLMLIGVSAYAQRVNEAKVPAVVKDAFKKNFAGMTAKWELEKGNYEANFKQNNQTLSALFDPQGKWLETETDIKISDLPAKVKSYVAQNYNGAKIKEAARIKKADGKINYEAEVKGKDLIFDEQGNFINAEKE